MADIKQKITDFVSFDVQNQYYDEDKKEDLVEKFKEILHEDEVVVRKFLERFFSSAEAAARDFGLIAKVGDTEEEPVDEPEETEEQPEEDLETPEEEPEEDLEKKQENAFEAYCDAAANFLYE